MADLPPPIPAATVVLLRDTAAAGIEVLMLHKVSQVAFGGMWVFPGGKIDENDRQGDDPGDDEGLAAARRAAARESLEECGLALEPAEFVPFAHWVPPPVQPKRFATWFFVARASDGDVVVDGGEMDDHAWLHPHEVLARRDRGEVDLAPPTWVTLHDVGQHGTVDDVLRAAAAQASVPHYETHWTGVEGGAVALWHGDAGYATSDPLVDGERHRLWMVADGWRLERG
jgi:8-oxo-dGTP pyrophosphatase MutT (NUDIX family)